ncbi:MAG: hypothetical protein M1549_02775 [Candidatus Dependentiae bacterium]|nr:hypothetical protein [Candidatus Dependentiae bacterium]
MNGIKLARFCAAAAVILISRQLGAFMSNDSRSDPYPVFTADSDLAPFIYEDERHPLQNVRISGSFYRQAANTAGLANLKPLYQPTTLTSSDVEIGDMYGPWALLALFYPEANGSTEVQAALMDACGIASGAPVTAYFVPTEADPTGLFGGDSVPVLYRKYGGRFELDMVTPYWIGARAEFGFGRVEQFPTFTNLTSTSTYPDAAKTEVTTDVMNQFTTAIAPKLALSVAPYCHSDMQDLRFYLYFCHAFEGNNKTVDGSYMPKLVFTPYVEFDCAPIPLGRRPYSALFAPAVGNDGHKAIGVTAGFTLNFLDMFTIGMDGSVTHFSEELRCNCPVPTNRYQVGVFSRKADLLVQPGKNFSFGLTLSSEYFWYNFSAWIELRLVNHSMDNICLVDMVNVPGIPVPSDYPLSNIMLGILRDRSDWSTSVGNVGLTYDFTDAISLGFFWQAPIRQRYTYRATTVMGTIFGTF